MMEEDNELPSTTLFFSRRAKLVAKVTPEEIKAATELFNKTQEEKLKAASSDANLFTPLVQSTQKPLKAKRTKKAFPDLGPSEENLENPPSSISCDVTLSAAAKKRLMKLQNQRDLELKYIAEENKKLFLSLESSEISEVAEVPSVEFDNMSVWTVSYMSEISRLKCYDNDKFSTIFPKVAELFKLETSEFLLSFKEQIINVDDTPKSLDLTVSDVLECIPYKYDESSESAAQYDANNLKISFQSNDTKEKLQVVVHKLEKMQSIMEKYSNQRDIPLDLLIFEFDGERITGSETPDDLEMESGNTIDVRVSASYIPSSHPPSKKKTSPKKTPPKKTPPKRKTQQKKKGRRGRPRKTNTAEEIAVDSDSNDSDILLCE